MVWYNNDNITNNVSITIRTTTQKGALNFDLPQNHRLIRANIIIIENLFKVLTTDDVCDIHAVSINHFVTW